MSYIAYVTGGFFPSVCEDQPHKHSASRVSFSYYYNPGLFYSNFHTYSQLRTHATQRHRSLAPQALRSPRLLQIMMTAAAAPVHRKRSRMAASRCSASAAAHQAIGTSLQYQYLYTGRAIKPSSTATCTVHTLPVRSTCTSTGYIVQSSALPDPHPHFVLVLVLRTGVGKPYRRRY